MKLETFFDNFELLAEAPNGVQKLRKLILQLAVRGTIVPQDPTDEPASLLLDKIKAEKEWLIKEKKIKKDQPVLPIQGDQVPYEVPKSWEWVRLGSICNQITDGTHYTPTYTVTGVPFISVKDITSGRIDLINTRYISKEEHEELIKRCNPEFEDVLLTKVGTTGIAKVIDVDAEFSIFVSLALLKFSKQLLSPYFIELVINSPFVKEQSRKNTQGVGNKNLVLKHIKNFVLPIPPFEEQKRIVAKVDQLMALCDELEVRQRHRREGCVLLNNAALAQLLTAREPEDFSKHWQRICDNFDLLYSTPENIGKLRQAILQLAVQGKLVPQDPNDEPASVLLEKIKAEKEWLIKEGKIKKDKSLPPIEVDEIPAELPKGWSVERFGNLVLDFQNGISTRKSEKGEPIPVLRLADIKAGQLSEASLREIHLTSSEIDKYQVIKGDILVIRVNGSAELVGRFVPCLVNKNWGYCDHLIRVRISHHLLNQNYLCFFGSSNEARKYLARKTITTAGQKTINQAGLASLIVWIPPLNEQKRIVAKVDQIMALCDALEAKLTQSQTDSEKLIEVSVRQALTT